MAGIPDGHACRFRDTFSVELLLAGVPVERVSIILGHKRVRITEKDYAPWVHARQEQLEADVRRTWETPEPQRRVHGGYTKKRARVIAFKSRSEWCRRGESGFGTSLTRRKLLILLNGKNAENTEFAQVRYTAGTRFQTFTFQQRYERFLGEYSQFAKSLSESRPALNGLPCWFSTPKPLS